MFDWVHNKPLNLTSAQKYRKTNLKIVNVQNTICKSNKINWGWVNFCWHTNVRKVQL